MIHILLPAYNEAGSLPRLLDSLHEHLSRHQLDHRILVVDDGSVDSTASLAEAYGRRMPLDLVRHETNQGLGAAMRSGFRHLAASCSEHDEIATMDADNTHDPAILVAMRNAILRNADVVIASRYAPGGEEIGLQFQRRILSRGASTLLAYFFPIPGVRDYTCGYRMYRASIVRRLIDHYGEDFIQEDGFVCMAEILVKMARLSAQIVEIPLVLRYDLKVGESKLKKIRTIGRYLNFVTRERWSRRRL